MAFVTIIGDTAVVAGFASAAANVNDRLQEAGKPVADKIADTQRNLFAANFTSRSGETYGSISAVPSERDDALFEVGPETFYSRFLEDGTVKMPARPFVGPSGDLHEGDWHTVVRDVAADI